MAGYAANDATARMINERAKSKFSAPVALIDPDEAEDAWWQAARELRDEFEKEGLTGTVAAIDDLMERNK